MPDDFLLMATLEVAVPLWIERVRPMPMDARLARAQELADVVAAKGDVIMFKSSKKGESGAAFNALAEALAIMAFAPGGVLFNGQRWEAT